MTRRPSSLSASRSKYPAGKFYQREHTPFRLFDSPSDRNIVQIFSADGTELFATILAINNYRLTTTGKTVMLFSERPAMHRMPSKHGFIRTTTGVRNSFIPSAARSS